jgi:murein DD-endopeptidase MepM/ murein hydrolase activator NlpD
MAFHSGVDLAGPEHAKVLATNDGKVEFAGWQSAYGNMVDIKHQYGLSTRYAHLERVLVQPEQWVKKGQVIGIQGSTGRSTGHHLHYEVRYQGRAINPNNFLKAGENVQASN